MAISYDVQSVALTIGTTAKWLDNLLSHHSLPGVSGGRQGIQRQITPDGLLAIEMTRMLASDLGIPLRRAAMLSTRAIEQRANGDLRVITDAGITLALPLVAIQARLQERLILAAESVVPRARGRRPARIPVAADGHDPESKTPDA